MRAVISVLLVLLVSSPALAGPRPSAKALNKQGLAARGAGDGAQAMALYRKAVAADPKYAAARYNLACEEARAGQKDAALTDLEALMKLRTAGRRFVAAAREDADFATVLAEPRFMALQRTFDIDASKPILSQLCADPARLISVVDKDAGLIAWTDITDVPDESGGTVGAQRLRGGKARAAAANLLQPGVFCTEGGRVGKADDGCDRWRDKILTPAKDGGLVCIEQPGCGEWSSNYGLCFGQKKDGRWALVLVSTTDSGVLVDDPSFMQKVGSRMQEQKNAAAALLK